MLLVKACSQEGTYLVYTGKTNVKLSHPRKRLHVCTPPLAAEEQKEVGGGGHSLEAMRLK